VDLEEAKPAPPLVPRAPPLRLGHPARRPQREAYGETVLSLQNEGAEPTGAPGRCRGRGPRRRASRSRRRTKDLAAGSVLELLQRYPTARLLAAATPADLAGIPYLPDQHVATLLAHARASIASLDGAAAAELVREQVRQLRDSDARQKRLESLLVNAYRALPHANHLDTIPGIGAVTAAVLTAFMLAIDRFATPAQLVAYFGALPVEVVSGVDRDGQARAPVAGS
jgi:transposase